jgi:hypothetical protein
MIVLDEMVLAEFPGIYLLEPVWSLIDFKKVDELLVGNLV